MTTGPMKVPDEIWEAWYHRMKDMLNVIHARGFGIAVHPKTAPMMKDMLERLAEDPEWTVRHGREVPFMIESVKVKEGDVMPADRDTAEAVHLREVVRSRIGFGRFRGLQVPSPHTRLPTWIPPGSDKK